jgi:uncharacterized protein (TIGR01777 family)
MKILVTGATGFVGQYVMEELIRAGHEIVALTRDSKKAQKKIPFPCEIYDWNPTTELIPEMALKGVEGVIHLLGENVAAGRWTQNQKEKILNSRVKSTQNLIESIKKFGSQVKVISSASAVGIYPRNKPEDLMTEEYAVGEGFLADVCKQWEAALGPQDQSIRKNILRIGVVLGAEEGALKKLLPIFKLGGGGIVGNGKQWMSWIHVRDLARAFVFTLENPSTQGVYNAVAPNPVRNSEFTKALADSLGKPAIFPVPAIALKAAMGEMSSIVLDSLKVVPHNFAKAGFEFQFKNIQDAFNEINCRGKYHLEREISCERLRQFQFINKPIEELFNFFGDASNLERMTPEWINFKILEQSTPSIQKGTVFKYQLKLHGLPIKWTTIISDWEKNKKFVDYQSSGPYKVWHHTHEFISYKGGTLMLDDVKYQVPMGFAGQMAGLPFVKHDVKKIFNFRKEVIGKLL